MNIDEALTSIRNMRPLPPEKELRDAIDCKDVNAIRSALSKGANPNFCQGDYISPFERACLTGELAIVKLLLDAGVKFEPYNIHEVVESGRGTDDRTELLAFFIDNGADVNSMSAQVPSAPLHKAARHKYRNKAELLIQRGARINQRDHCGHTPLHIAASAQCVPMMKLFLSHGADVSLRSDTGETPLHAAIFTGSDAVRLLIAHGADVNVKNSDGHSPLDSALGCRPEWCRGEAVPCDPEVIQLLRETMK